MMNHYAWAGPKLSYYTVAILGGRARWTGPRSPEAGRRILSALTRSRWKHMSPRPRLLNGYNDVGLPRALRGAICTEACDRRIRRGLVQDSIAEKRRRGMRKE